MQIEVFTPDEPLGDGEFEEVWVRVLANQVVDWPTVRGHLAVQLEGFPMRPTAYFPHTPDGSEHDYKFEDHWVLRKDR